MIIFLKDEIVNTFKKLYSTINITKSENMNYMIVKSNIKNMASDFIN